ncbi:hypothetical protein GQ457_12G031810 [Hibiscus cannabinus]
MRVAGGTEDVRIHKVETSLEKFSGKSAVKIPNLSAMEVNIIRPFVGRALQAFYKHDNPEKIPDVDRPSSAQTRVANNEPRVCSSATEEITNHFQPAYDEGTSVLLETLFGNPTWCLFLCSCQIIMAFVLDLC